MSILRYWPACLFLAIVVSASMAAYYTLRDTRPDIEKIQGEWTADLSADPNAKNISSEEANMVRYVFRDDRMTMEVGGNVVAAYTVTLDPTKNPKEIDMAFAPVETMPLLMRGMMALLAQHPSKGIYRLTGDELVIHQTIGDGRRPRDFTPAQGCMVMILRRATIP